MQIYTAADDEATDFEIRWALRSSQESEKPIRRAQQYAVLCKEDAELFFALYDGHGGAESAHIAAHGIGHAQEPVKPLHDIITQSQDEYPLSYKRAYRIINDLICDDRSHRSGTSAITLNIEKSGSLTYSFVGNSRMLFIKKNKISVTNPHTIANQYELERVKQSEGGDYFLRSAQNILRTSSIITRSLGDRNIKECVKGIIAEPSINKISILKNGRLNYEAVIMATRSFWDSVGYQEADAVIQDALLEEGHLIEGKDQAGNSSSIKYVAKKLIDFAQSVGCVEDVTVIVITFSLKKPVIYALDIDEDDLIADVPKLPRENAVERSFNPCFVVELQRRLLALQEQGQSTVFHSKSDNFQ